MSDDLPVVVDVVRRVRHDPHADAGEATEESRARLAGNPMGRLGETDDIANAVSYLTSDGAAFVTGTVMHVNGGSYT